MADSDAGGGSDDVGSEAEIWAISPSFSTEGATEVWFHADTEIESNNNGECLILLEASPDGGTTWLPVWVSVEPQRVIKDIRAVVPTAEMIDGWPELGSASQTKSFAGIHGRWDIQFPSEVANQPNVQFRTGWFESADAWWIALDNILVDSNPPPMGGETVLLEDFEGGIPATWTNTTGKTQLWDTRPLWDEESDEPLKIINNFSVHIDLVRMAEMYEMEISMDEPDQDINPNGITDGGWILMLAGQGYAMWQEGPYEVPEGEESESATLDTPVLDLSSATEVFLDFDSEMLRGDGSVYYDVFVSVDGGQNFEQIFTYTGALMDNGESAYFTHHYLEVPEAAGNSSVIFRFRAEGQDPCTDSDPFLGDSGTMEGFWAIDNVRVTATVGAGLPLALPFTEDFEGLPLGPNVDEAVAGDNVWTKTAPEGWTIDDSGVPGIAEGAGVTEWRGWSFADLQWWVTTAEDQDRSQFTNASGTVAIADPDEWDDKDDPESFGTYNTFLSTPPISLDGAAPNTVVLTFDSSWRDEDNQKVNITVSYDGGDPVEVLRWVSLPETDANFHDDFPNETVTVELNNPAGAQQMVVTWGMQDAGNDWWWAIDNVEITVPVSVDRWMLH